MQRKPSSTCILSVSQLTLQKIKDMIMHGAEYLLNCALMHPSHAGRALYALIELVDVTCYATAYRGVFMVVINRLRSALSTQGAEVSSSLALFPAVLAAVDYLEDFLQVARLNLKHH